MIPDLALQHTIVAGLSALKREPRRIDQLFANLPADIRGQIREFFVSTPIQLTHGYPQETARLPSIALVLHREEESRAFLGRALDPGPLDDRELVFEQRDRGRRRPPERAEPDLSDALVEKRAAEFPDEQAPLLYTEDDLIAAQGRLERLVYEAEVRTQDYFATAFLHRVLKAVLMSATPSLEAWGVHNLLLSGSDLEHAAQDYPHLVFARVLSLQFDYVFSIYEAHDRLRTLSTEIGAGRGPTPEVTLRWDVTIP